jgi:hypothetical protein
VTVLTFSVALIGAFTCGFFQNPLDIAPNFTGNILYGNKIFVNIENRQFIG